jgi:hypothetical protein
MRDTGTKAGCFHKRDFRVYWTISFPRAYLQAEESHAPKRKRVEALPWDLDHCKLDGSAITDDHSPIQQDATHSHERLDVILLKLEMI